MPFPVVVYLLSFVGIWIGSGLAIKSVERLSRSLKFSSFTVSFIILGLFTSVGELSVGINAIFENDPEIYVGNLIGASIVLFMLVMPLLAVAGNSVRLRSELQGFNLPASLAVIGLPVILAMDGRIGRTDSVVAMLLFGFLLIIVQSRRSLKEKLQNINKRNSVRAGKEFLKILFGVMIIFVASRLIVQQTIYFSGLLNVSPFFVSLILIAVGTNVPELSLVVRSIFMRKHQVAFGGYVGSAAFNTFLLGFLTFWYGQPVLLAKNYITSLLFLAIGLGVFYYFARTKNTISRLEGLVLLVLYTMFVFTEILIR